MLCGHHVLAGVDVGAVLLRCVRIGNGNEPGLDDHLARNQHPALHIAAQAWLPLQEFSPGNFARLGVACAPVGIDHLLKTLPLKTGVALARGVNTRGAVSTITRQARVLLHAGTLGRDRHYLVA
jgi:hypothetical protein